MDDKIILEKVKNIEEIPISPTNMNSIAICYTNVRRPNNPEPSNEINIDKDDKKIADKK